VTSTAILAKRRAVALADAVTAVIDGESAPNEEREERLRQKAGVGSLSSEFGANSAEVIALLASQVAELRQEVAALSKKSSSPKKSASKKKQAS
jgi:hypothetical protein